VYFSNFFDKLEEVIAENLGKAAFLSTLKKKLKRGRKKAYKIVKQKIKKKKKKKYVHIFSSLFSKILGKKMSLAIFDAIEETFSFIETFDFQEKQVFFFYKLPLLYFNENFIKFSEKCLAGKFFENSFLTMFTKSRNIRILKNLLRNIRKFEKMPDLELEYGLAPGKYLYESFLTLTEEQILENFKDLSNKMGFDLDLFVKFFFVFFPKLKKTKLFFQSRREEVAEEMFVREFVFLYLFGFSEISLELISPKIGGQCFVDERVYFQAIFEIEKKQNNFLKKMFRLKKPQKFGAVRQPIISFEEISLEDKETMYSKYRFSGEKNFESLEKTEFELKNLRGVLRQF